MINLVTTDCVAERQELIEMIYLTYCYLLDGNMQ